MPFFTLLQRESRIVNGAFIALIIISGLSNAAVMAIINAAVETVEHHEENFRLLMMLVLVITLFVVSQRRLMGMVARQVEQVVHRLRVRLVERARRAELLEIENIGRSEIFSCISRETKTLSQASAPFVVAAQSAVLVTFTLLYIAWLSETAFALSVIFTAIGAAIHLLRSAEVKRKLREAYEYENQFLDTCSDLLDGFKEAKMDHARAVDITEKAREISLQVALKKTEREMLYANDFVFSQVTFFVLTGMMVFIVPILSPTYIHVAVMTTTAALFMIGPVGTVVSAIPLFLNTNAAASSILTLEERMASLERQETEDPAPFTGFQTIRLENLRFRHRSAENGGFTVGPVNLTIERGSTIFITGGNGSGKSTFVRLMIGLYPAEQGRIRVDGKPVDGSNLNAYRRQFSVIFSDNHLFQELYGLREIDQELADELFDLLEIRHKSRLIGRSFTNVKLSGGQRKRLALIASLLEKKPICVFDEWAADQDPHFRAKFYRDILPRLKERGITVLAVTHDEKYFDVADVHLHMEEGQLQVVHSRSVLPASETVA